jgi:hypothetical protein
MVGFPLLLIPLAIYNIVALLMPGVPLTDPLVRLTLVSGVEWHVTLGDVLLTLGVLLLLLEIMKGARPGSKYLTDHLLSLIVFGGSAAEFVMLPKFGTSTFFLLTLMAMVDFVGGIALHARRRPVAAPVARRVPEPVEVAAPEPERRIEPVPAQPAPAAATVAEPALSDDSKPKASTEKPVIDNAATDEPATDKPAIEPSPTIASPDLQPGSGSSSSPGTPH